MDANTAHPFRGIGYDRLIAMSNRELDEVMRIGLTPTSGDLAGSEFRGYNTPFFTRILGIQKFIKGFFVDERGQLAGYNLVVERPRSGPASPWVPKKGRGRENGHGFYDVRAVHEGTRYDDFPNAVLLDYGSGRNGWLNPESRIRDFLVRVDPGNPDIFLGKAYLDLGLFRVFSNFFVLERR